METLLTVIHVFVGFVLIFVVLLQTGKGGAMGSAFGGSSQTVFGTSGAGNFLTKFTTGAAIVFMVTSLTLSSMSSRKEKASLVTSGQAQEAKESKVALPKLPSEPSEKEAAAPADSQKTGAVEQAAPDVATGAASAPANMPAQESPPSSQPVD